MNENDDDHSVLDGVISVESDPRAEASYEAAMEGINRVIGRLSALVWEEEHQDQPDQARIDALTGQQAHWAQVSAELDPADRRRDCRGSAGMLPAAV